MYRASARAIATLVLGNFVDQDTTWHGLVLTLTDPEDRVTDVAQSLLQGLIYSDRRRPVDWSAAREPLLALFDSKPLLTVSPLRYDRTDHGEKESWATTAAVVS